MLKNLYKSKKKKKKNHLTIYDELIKILLILIFLYNRFFIIIYVNNSVWKSRFFDVQRKKENFHTALIDF